VHDDPNEVRPVDPRRMPGSLTSSVWRALSNLAMGTIGGMWLAAGPAWLEAIGPLGRAPRPPDRRMADGRRAGLRENYRLFKAPFGLGLLAFVAVTGITSR
jgi:hypothetical protein